jgi:gliding motility-associated-like protein
MKITLPPSFKNKNKTYYISIFLICSILLNSYASLNYSKTRVSFINPTATISASSLEICKNESSTITFEGSGGTEPYTFTYKLNDDDSIKITTTSGNSVSITLNGTTIGNYTYKLIEVKDNTETVQEITDQEITIKVNTPPTADFTFPNEDDNACSGETVKFKDNSTGIGQLTYNWDFGDTNTSTQRNPNHVFEALGCGTKTFNVKLTVTDNKGCSSSKTRTISVKEKPSFEIFDVSEKDFSKCGNTSSTDPNFEINVGLESDNASPCITNYNIKWGDGNEENTNSFPIAHNYVSLGVYDMVITASSSNGCSNIIRTTVKNISNPSGSIVNPGSTQNICAPTNAIPFVISSWGNNSLDTRYEINYGDGATLALLQTDLINTSYYNSADPVNSENYKIPHVYTKSSCPETYTASLNVINACGTTPSLLPNISILEKPKLAFSFSEKACVNTSVTFINNSIYGNGNNCDISGRFTWDFGDGTTTGSSTSLDSKTHSYSSPGKYIVKLSATSFCGEIEITKEICIEPKITTSFTADNLVGCIPFDLKTTNNTNQAELCSIPTYNWAVVYTSDNCGTFNDWVFTNGTDENSENAEFTFNTPGKYRLTQSTTTACGTETDIRIIDVKKPPTASIQEIDDACGNLTINPIADIENCTTNADSLTYNWTFTGGTPVNSTTLNPGSIEYNTPGPYTVTLEVSNECGVSNTASEEFEVFEIPSITNTNLTQEICSSQSTSEITLNSESPNTTYTWSAIASSGITGFTPNGNSNKIPAQILTNSENNSGTVTYTAAPAINGCTGDETEFIITVNPALVISKQPFSSEVCLNGTATLLEVASQNGTTAATYQWFSNIKDSTIDGTQITNATNDTYNPPTDTVGETFYYVEIYFATSVCSKIVSNTASVNVVPQITVNPVATPQTICVGGTANEFEVTYSGGTGNPSYQWFSNIINVNIGGTLISGATNSTYTPDAFSNAGDYYYYTEISLDGNGCNSASSDVFEVNVLPDPVIDEQPIANQELCQGAIPTDLTVSISGGTNSSTTYQWYQNTTNSISGGTVIQNTNSASYTPETVAPGTFYYYVIVSQSEAGCSVTSTVSELKVNEAPIVSKQPISSEICSGGTATLLEVVYQNGTGTASYQWFSNTTDSTIDGTPISNEINSSYTPPTDTFGETFYYVEISFTTGGCSKIVSNIASVAINETPVISSAEITTYSKITFNFNPSSIAGNTIPTDTKYTWPVPTFNPANSINGASAETDSQDKISQTLENTGTTPVIVSYTITPATTKCVGEPFILEVTVNSSITSNAVITNNTCFESNDGSIVTNITGGTPFETDEPYLISWTGPNGFAANDETINNLQAGLYIVTIEDKEGFSITEELKITQPNILSISNDLEKNISCFQGNDGAIELTISGGTLPYTFNWSTSNGSGIIQNTESQNTLTAGTYTLEIIDKNKCTTTTSITLTEPEELIIENIFKQSVLCFGDATGTIEIDVSGGTPIEVSNGVFEYIYDWSGPEGFTSISKDINNLIAGTYTVTVTDSFGCTTTATIIISQSPEIELNYTKTDVTCYQETDGSIDVNVTGGAAPYQISWSNLANGFSLSNLSAGTYVATITDGNSCTKRVSIIIEEPIFFIDPVVTLISCNGKNDGAIDLNLTGGVPPFSLTWDDDINAGVQRNNLSPGSYRVVIVDSDTYQCPIEQVFILTNALEIAVSTTVVDALDCDIVNSGSINMNVFGGNAPFSFLWNTNETSEDLENLPPGDYSVEITDSNGCSLTKQFNIFRQEPIRITLEEITLINCDLKIERKQTEAKVTGGYLPYTYTWSAGTISGADNNIMTTDQNGSYTLTITDDKGCTESKSFIIDVPATIGNTDFRYSAFALNKYDLLSIEDPIQFTNISTGNYSKSTWDFGDGSPIVTDQNPIHIYDEVGTFTVILKVEYNAGCIEYIERTVNITKGYALINPNAFTPNGDGYNDVIRPSYRGFITLEMTIYDTWGTSVYYEKNINLNGWNGTINGLPAENGNYVMVIRGLTFYKKEILTSTPLTLLK